MAGAAREGATRGRAPRPTVRQVRALEQQLAERSAALAARVSELEVISAIQRGVASQLGFQAIIDLVGDKLREVFATGNVGIVWWDRETDLMHVLYRYEHGQPLPRVPPRKPTPDHGAWPVLQERAVGVVNTRADMVARGLTPRSGTDWARSMVAVPIIGSDRVIGLVNLQNHEREHAYGEAEVRLLQTIAASMGIALENARLVEETKAARSQARCPCLPRWSATAAPRPRRRRARARGSAG